MINLEVLEIDDRYGLNKEDAVKVIEELKSLRKLFEQLHEIKGIMIEGYVKTRLSHLIKEYEKLQ